MSSKIKINIKYSNEYFTTHIANNPEFSTRTKSKYLGQLKIVINELFGRKEYLWWVLQHPIEFEEAINIYGKTKGLNGYPWSPSTMFTYAKTMKTLWFDHPELVLKHKELYDIWQQLVDKLKIPEENRIIQHLPTSRQEKAIVPWEYIITKRDLLPNGLPGKILLCMYTMIPPCRSDFSNVRLYWNGVPEEITKSDNTNYIDIQQSKLILNKYKTAAVYGTNVIQLPTELIEQINYSRYREYLFVGHDRQPYKSEITWNHWANRFLKTVLNRPTFSITMFRHLYQNKIRNKTMDERRDIAQKMGHSIRQAVDYDINGSDASKVNNHVL